PPLHLYYTVIQRCCTLPHLHTFPTRRSSDLFENMPCSAWPNSWNMVVTSSQVSRVGWPSGGSGMFRWFATTGIVSSRPDCDTYAFIHAPPRLDGRAYMSEMKIA